MDERTNDWMNEWTNIRESQINITGMDFQGMVKWKQARKQRRKEKCKIHGDKEQWIIGHDRVHSKYNVSIYKHSIILQMSLEIALTLRLQSTRCPATVDFFIKKILLLCCGFLLLVCWWIFSAAPISNGVGRCPRPMTAAISNCFSQVFVYLNSRTKTLCDLYFLIK